MISQNIQQLTGTTFGSIKRALQLVWNGSKGWSILNSMFFVVQGVLPLFQLYVTKLVIDEITGALQNNQSETVFTDILGYIAILAGISLFGTVLGTISSLTGTIQVELVADYLYKRIHKKSIELDLEFYENPDYYDTLHRAQQDAQSRPMRITGSLMSIGQNIISLVAVLGLLLTFHWAIAVILFVSAIPGLLIRFRYADKIYKWNRHNTPAYRHTMYFNWLLTNEIHATELRLFGLGEHFSSRFQTIRKRLRIERITMARQFAVIGLVTQFGVITATFVSYTFIAYRAVNGIVTLGDFVMLYQAFQRGQGFLGSIFGGLGSLYEDTLFLSNLYEFFDLKPRISPPANPTPPPKPMQTGIRFENVSFNYAASQRDTLKDINLTISPGEVVAIVGENGSGKTTLVKLLCRLYDPTEGRITIDGIDYNDIDPLELHRELSVVFQDYAHYQLTARENIWFGNIDLAPNDERIIEAAERSGAAETINKLKNGYDTMLGKWFEECEELSIGEWQKIALARAFLRDAQVLVLDEPSSAMDARAELQVFTRFRELAEGKTTVLISHRMSTVRMADRIYVMNEGRIVEQGTHDELLNRGGLYASLYNLQARNYQEDNDAVFSPGR